KLARLVQADLVHRILDQLRCFDHRLVDIGANLAGVLVQLGAHVFLRLVILARGEGDGVLDSGDHDAGIDALVAAQSFNALVKHTCHSSLSVALRPLLRYGGALRRSRGFGSAPRYYPGADGERAFRFLESSWPSRYSRFRFRLFPDSL